MEQHLFLHLSVLCRGRKELLEHTDIDVNYKNARGGTALVEAIVLGNGSENHKKVIQMLIDHGADVNILIRKILRHCNMLKKRF